MSDILNIIELILNVESIKSETKDELSKLEIEERDLKIFYNQNKDALNVSYSEVKERINETLYQEQSSKAINLYIEQLKAKAEIVIPGAEPEEEVEVEDEEELEEEETDEEEETTEEETDEEEEVEETTEAEAETEDEEEVVEETEEELEEVTEEEVEIEIIVEEPSITSFTLTEDEICLKDEKPIVIFYTVSKCDPCNALKESFNEAIEDKEVVAYLWELDTGDNLLTEELEKGITKSDLEIFRKYNEKSTVPTIVAGCKYVGIGNIDSEEISLVIDNLEE